MMKVALWAVAGWLVIILAVWRIMHVLHRHEEPAAEVIEMPQAEASELPIDSKSVAQRRS